eukprot:9466764-Pyramimonas_sp.AAC.1
MAAGDDAKVMLEVSFVPGLSHVTDAALALAKALEETPGQLFADAMFEGAVVAAEELVVNYVAGSAEAGSGLFSEDCYQVSAVQPVLAGVAHLNHVPEGCAHAGFVCEEGVRLAYGEREEVHVRLPASDRDGDAVTVALTYMPRNGQLKVNGVLVEAEGVAVPMVGGVFAVTYVPLTNGVGFGFDRFGYTVSDGQTTSAEHMVQVHVEDGELPAPAPVAGNAGFALAFDGVANVALLGNMSSMHLLNGEFSVGMWMKTSAAAGETRMTLLSAGPYKLHWTNVLGLQFSVEGRSVPTFAALNDGLWHYVAASFDGYVAVLYVDGKLAGARQMMGEMGDVGPVVGPNATD